MIVFLTWSAEHIFPQENVVKQTRVGVSATYANDLKIDQGIHYQDTYFEFSEKSMQMNDFWGLNNLLPLTQMKYFGLQALVRAEKSYIICLVNIKLAVKPVFSSGM